MHGASVEVVARGLVPAGHGTWQPVTVALDLQKPGAAVTNVVGSPVFPLPLSLGWSSRLPDCHSIDWHRVSVAAIRIAAQAHSEGLSGEASADRASEIVLAEKLAAREQRADRAALSRDRHPGISRGDDGEAGISTDRHRTTAMLEADVRRTVMIRWNMPDSAQGAG